MSNTTATVTAAVAFVAGAGEPATQTWYAYKGQHEQGIFDTFGDDAGRQAHLEGKVAAALMANAPKMLARTRTSRKSKSSPRA